MSHGLFVILSCIKTSIWCVSVRRLILTFHLFSPFNLKVPHTHAHAQQPLVGHYYFEEATVTNSFCLRFAGTLLPSRATLPADNDSSRASAQHWHSPEAPRTKPFILLVRRHAHRAACKGGAQIQERFWLDWFQILRGIVFLVKFKYPLLTIRGKVKWQSHEFTCG